MDAASKNVAQKLFGKKSQIAILASLIIGMALLVFIRSKTTGDYRKIMQFAEFFYALGMIISYLVVTFVDRVKAFACECRNELATQYGKCCTKRTLILALAAFALLLFRIYPMLRADYSYVDDTAHNLYGIPEWGWNFGRWVTYISHILMNFNVYISDTSPFQQVVGVASSLLVSLIVAFVFSSLTREEKVSIPLLIASLCMAVNPYFLGCLAYKYDSIGMAFSYLFAVLPFLLCRDRKAFFFVSIITNLLLCLSYQAANGVFVTMTLFIAFSRFALEEDFKMKDLLLFYATAALSFIIGLLLFYVPFMLLDHSAASYRSVTFGQGGIIAAFIRNTKSTISIYLTDFNIVWKIVVALTMAAFFVQSMREAKKGKAITAALALFTLGVGFLLCLGAYSVLSDGVGAANMIFGFGAYLGLVATAAVAFSGKGKMSKALCTFPLALVLTFFFYGFIHGNALKAQYEYEDEIRAMVLSDLNANLEKKDGKYPIAVEGNVGRAPVVEHVASLYPITRRMVPVMLGGDHWFARLELIRYPGNKFETVDQEEVLAIKDEFEPFIERLYYRILRKGDTLIVDFT